MLPHARRTSFASLLSEFSSSSSSSSHGARSTTPPGLFVIRSPFTRIYTNLAIEESLLRALSFARSTRTLLLYSNMPAVVLGRHQNAWLECNVPACRAAGVHVQRRHSGGGTVYHDEGTLCMSFMTAKQEYNPARNMQLLAQCLRDADLISPNSTTVAGCCRHDLFLRESSDDKAVQKKISGSAMRITSHGAYHHCTMLCDANLDNVRGFLKHTEKNSFAPTITKNKATESVRSPVTSLSLDSGRRVTTDDVSTALQKAFFSATTTTTTTPDKPPAFPQLFDLEDNLDELLRTEFSEPPSRRTTVMSVHDELLDPSFVFGAGPVFSFDQPFAVPLPSSPLRSVSGLINISTQRGGAISSIGLTQSEVVPAVVRKTLHAVLEAALMGRQLHLVARHGNSDGGDELRRSVDEACKLTLQHALSPDDELPMLRDALLLPDSPSVGGNVDVEELARVLSLQVVQPLLESSLGSWV